MPPLRPEPVAARTAICVALGLALAGPAAAQEDTVAARRDTTALRLPTLDVTTTATRSTRAPMAQPLAITRVDEAAFRGRRGTGLDDALTFVPGVLAQSRGGWSDVRLVIRGFGARGAGDRSNAGTSRGVRVLVDGFPETEPDGRTAFDLVDLTAAGSLDVIRSNASAVWGNAAGGVVSISTLRGATRSYLTLDPAVGSFGFRRFSLSAGARPGSGELANTVTWAAFDGWRAHSAGERLLVNTAVNLPVGTTHRLGVFALGGYNRYDIPGPLTMTALEADPTQANATYLARRERRFNRVGRLGVGYEWHPDERHELRATLYVSPKVLQRSERGTFRDFTRYHVGGSAIYRYRAPVGPSASSILSVGVDEAYQDGAILFYDLTADGERARTLRTNKQEGANNLGVFVQEEVLLGARWAIVAGARYDNIRYAVDDFLDARGGDARAFTRLSPKLGVNFRRSPTHAFYASLGGGIEAPAGNETDPASTFGQDSVYLINPLLDPIQSTSVEVGTKQVVVWGAAASPWELSYDAALYHTAVRNEIVPYRGGRFYFTAGRAARSGLEVGGRLSKGAARLQGMLTWSHHRYREYVVDSVHYGRPGATADFGGNRVVGVPDWVGALGVGLAPRGLGGLRGEVTFEGTSGYWADDANTVRVDGYRLLHLTVTTDRPVRLAHGIGLRGTVSLNNLLDRSHVASAFLNPDLVGGVPVAFEPGLPRHVTVAISVGGDR